MQKLLISLFLLLFLLTAGPVFATQIHLFVDEMSATAVQSRDETSAALKTLLTSRLSGDRIVVVGSAAEADVVVNGTYIAIGKMFSIDAVAKPVRTGKNIIRAFVQGETQDEMIPAVGKLADKLAHEIIKTYSGDQPATVSAPIKAPIENGLIKPKAVESSTADDWLSQRLNGAANLFAIGVISPDGSRDVFFAEESRLSYYRQGTEMKLVDEAELKTTEKIISLDTLEGTDGSFDIYLTIVRSGELASQVWQVKEGALVMVAKNLPYYFRSVSLFGGPKKLYAQSMGRNDDFFGDVAEATRTGSVITLRNPIKMPRFGNLYNFNQFYGRNGKTYAVVINPDGYVIVYNEQLNELWRSNDKFGGSELFFQRADGANMRTTGDQYRWIFMNQRIQVSSQGEVFVGKNDGFWVLGNARSYKRGAIYCLVWNGSSLEEKWHTRDTQNYMPDYFFDEARNELMFLQTVQRPGFASRGASSLTIKKIE